MTWRWFEGWNFRRGKWRRFYSRGPVQMGDEQSENEFVDLLERFDWAGLYTWNGSAWELTQAPA